jgi:hypothetical protein
MTTLGFEDYVEPLKLYLHKFRQAEVGAGLGSEDSQPMWCSFASNHIAPSVPCCFLRLHAFAFCLAVQAEVSSWL